MKKILLIIGVITIIIGAGLFVIGMSMLEWDFGNMSNRNDYETMHITYVNNNQDIQINDVSTKIEVKTSADDSIHIYYDEREKEEYEIDSSDEIISFTRRRDYKWFDNIYVLDFYTAELQILLPKGYQGELVLENINGDISVSDQELDLLTINTINSEIEVENCVVHGEMIIDTTNDDINITDVKATKIDAYSINSDISLNTVSCDAAEIETITGDVIASEIESAEIKITTMNGDIIGYIIGAREEYNINSNVMNGDSNLSELEDSSREKRISVSTMNGDIKFEFSE